MKPAQLEKIAFWVMLAALSVGFLWLLVPFYSVILLSLVLVLTVSPFYQWLLKITRERRHLSALITLFLLFLFLAFPVGITATLITDQVIQFAHGMQNQWGPNFLQQLLGEGPLVQKIEEYRRSLGIETDIGQWIKEGLQNSAHYLGQYSPKVAAKTAGFFFKSILVFLLSYFLFVDGPKLYHEILDLSPLKETYEKALAEEIRVTLKACIYGYVLTALVQGILGGLGFWILGFKAALIFGVATFIMAFVPIVGTGSVWVPIFIFLAATGQYGKAAFL
ncbi:MAG: AI-2E family transporter, partial [bacterium]|nr:AI-2E family transporter [bacterium]